jgi:hypothetical protein
MSYVAEVLADGPVGYWKMDELSGDLADSSGNGLTAVASGSPLYGRAKIGNALGTSVGADGGASLTFTVASPGPLYVGDNFTLEAWYRPEATFVGQYRSLMGISPWAWGLGANTLGQIYIFKTNPSGDVIATSSASMTVQGNHHIVYTKNGASSHIYINGVEGTTLGTNVTFNFYVDPFTLFGINQESMQHAAVYPSDLSPARVLAHYNAGQGIETGIPLTAISTQVVARW